MELLGLLFLGIPVSVLVLFGIFKFIEVTEKEKK